MPLISGLRFQYLFGSSTTTVFVRGLCTGARVLSKLVVKGLSYHTNEQVLKDSFSRYGQVLEVSIMVNPVTRRSKGYGYVQFASETEADNALNRMDGQLLNGRNISVDFAKPIWKNVGEAPPRAVGPPSWILEKNEKKEKNEKNEKNEKKVKNQKKETNEKNKKNEKQENNEKREKEKKDKKKKGSQD